MTRLTGTLPPAIRRDVQLGHMEKTLGREADVQLRKAAREMETALRDAGSAGASTASAAANVADAAWDGLKAAGNTAKGAGAAVVGGVARAAEVVQDALGAALQWFGKALLKVGNSAREVAGMGGPQVTTKTVEGDRQASLFSDRMFKLSRESFQVAGNQWKHSLAHLAASGRDLGDAAHHVASAADHTLRAATATGNAAAIKTAQVAVATARDALMALERGVDGAGALLQKAGMAVIDAGNEVNTLRGSDTAAATVQGGR
ncbi:MAG: hypothetical protein HY904_11220 [Deltaproteobacteria bacterium]|nr:hypothetical protein [Deltaproteobacteria bacterium]